MRRRSAIVLGALAGVLLAIILAEWVLGEARLARMEAPGPVRAAAAGRAAAPADNAAAPEAVDAWLRTALARPLMTASRAPVATSGPTLSLSNGLPRLAGTLAGAGATVAIFARDDGGHPVVVREGGNLGPYRVTHIVPNSVTLEGPSGRQVLRERFGAHSAADAPNPPPPPLAMPGIVQPNFPQPNFPGLVPPQMRDPNQLLQMQQQQQQAVQQ